MPGHEPPLPAPGEQLATDGKGVKASVSDDDQSYQDFVSVVSAFSVAQGVVVGLETMRNQQTSEIKTVEVLLEKLQLQDVCFSLDALHTQKNSRAHSPERQRLSDHRQRQSTQVI